MTESGKTLGVKVDKGRSLRPTIDLSHRYWASRPRVFHLLAELDAAGWCRRTLYLRPNAELSADLLNEGIGDVLREAGETATGAAVFMGEARIIAIVPPFPLASEMEAGGAHTRPLVELLGRELVVGVILLRLGRYAVGVLRGDGLVASKTGSRYVKSRHRAGGSSQRRFERSRERAVRELFDEACGVVKDVLTPYEAHIDYVLLGGERHTLRAFVERCGYVKRLGPKTLGRVLEVDRPGQEALDRMAFEVWKSRVLVFDASSAS